DPDVGRRVGEELFEINLAAGLDQMMRSAGGAVVAIELLASHGSRLPGGWSLDVTDRGADWAEITSSTELEADHAFFCCTGMGYYTRVPEVFGHRATAVHPECMIRGAPALPLHRALGSSGRGRRRPLLQPRRLLRAHAEHRLGAGQR